MAVINEPADPLAKGIFATAKQSWGDLFRWKQRVVVTNELGESHTEWQSPEKLRNPISLLMLLSARNWIYFLVGLFAWTADAFDFHALAIQTVKLSHYYERSKTDITTAITLTLLLRSVGAAVFGLLGDRFGRKWPMVGNLIFLGLLQIATIYSATFQQFLAVRSLFGLFMGGVYGNAVAMALENCPTESRGLMSGILQQGYALGYVLAACANLGVGAGTDTWKTVFWIASGLSIGAGLLRCLFPESKQFREAKATGHHISAQDFWVETKSMLAKEWRMCVYCVFLMTWFNYYAHTSQDSYTTFMLESKELPNDAATRASILMNTGACVGGTIIGYLSQFIGRRRAIVGAALISCCLVPAWILPSEESGLSASGFAIQFFVQGAWGVVPIHLNELSPPAYRSTFPGLAYQLGNLVSSPAAQIVNAIAENNFVTSKSGKLVDGYGPTMGIALAIVAVGIAVTAALGPEKRGRSFEHAGPAGANIYIDVGKAVDNGSITGSTKVNDAEKIEV
ncbi:MFS general substrate transporter [Daldinia vernicosa]|uniref:MFS general substrate transporter n=1 Tax=Daldinia vernicosa TaxID=114800 RepID=UPI002008983A|nr:MFS general substrate transporter [Daldinia vernicosa]KAI0844330.1 MFS general substrate transporter [Daldinia vernicosa]